MNEVFSRMAMLVGEDTVEKMKGSHVALFGVGGVGGHCCEALARCGVGAFTLVDMDTVSPSNINRQAVAYHSTVGRLKTEVMREKILDINPQCRVRVINGFYSPENDLGVWEEKIDLVVDAIDTVSAKTDLIFQAQKRGIEVVSCMGAGNKLDPSAFEAADLFETQVCPLCRVMRKAARDKGIDHVRVVYSKEAPVKVSSPRDETGRSAPGSIAFVTAAAGLMLAKEAFMLLKAQRLTE